MPGSRADRLLQRPLHLGAGRVAAGVHDPVAVVAALPGQRQPAVRVGVERRAALDQLADPARALLDQHPHRGLVAEPDPGGQRVGQVLGRRVGRVERGRDPALGPAGRAVVDVHLGRPR